MLCSIALGLLGSVYQANISDTHAGARRAFIYDFGWDGHEVETLYLL